MRHFCRRNCDYCIQLLKPLSVTTNVVGLQTDDAGHVGQNSSTHVARVVCFQIDAVVVTETRFSSKLIHFRKAVSRENWRYKQQSEITKI